tara:strand:- start:22 stop:972 length:951 start_codon:yes stop_codon:yes gene_type:complete
MGVFAGAHKDYDASKSYREQKPVNRTPKNNQGSGGGGGGGSSNKDIAQQFNINQPGSYYADTGGTFQNFQKDLQKAAQFGLFTQHPYTKELMQKYNLNTQDVINLRLGTGSGGTGEAIPGLLYNKNYIPGIGPQTGNKPGVFQKVFSSGLIPMAMGPGNLAQQGIGAFKEGMSVYDYPPSQGFKDSLGQLLGSRFNFIAGGSPYGVAALGFGRNALGLEGDQLNQFASSVANDRNLYNQMMTQPYMKDQQFRNLMYDYQQQSNRDQGGQPVVGPKVVESDLKKVNPYLDMVKRYRGDQPIVDQPVLFARGGIATLN